MSAPPTVAVFGGTGFLGHNIVEHLRAKGFAVRVVARHPERAERIFGEPRPELSYQAGDLLDERSTAAAIEGVYMVVNAVSLYVERDGMARLDAFMSGGWLSPPRTARREPSKDLQLA